MIQRRLPMLASEKESILISRDKEVSWLLDPQGEVMELKYLIDYLRPPRIFTATMQEINQGLNKHG